MIRAKTSLDDSLDVVAAHGVGGTVGALLTGVFAEKALNGVADGALFGNPGQLAVQGTAVLAAIVYSGGMSFVLLKLIGLVIPLRVSASDEADGLDITGHGEEAYMHVGGASPARGTGGGRRRAAGVEAGAGGHLAGSSWQRVLSRRSRPTFRSAARLA